MVFSEDCGPCIPNGRIQADMDGVRYNSFIEGRRVTSSARLGKGRRMRARVSWQVVFIPP
jgi:hypothetical protein